MGEKSITYQRKRKEEYRVGEKKEQVRTSLLLSMFTVSSLCAEGPWPWVGTYRLHRTPCTLVFVSIDCSLPNTTRHKHDDNGENPASKFRRTLFEGYNRAYGNRSEVFLSQPNDLTIQFAPGALGDRDITSQQKQKEFQAHVEEAKRIVAMYQKEEDAKKDAMDAARLEGMNAINEMKTQIHAMEAKMHEIVGRLNGERSKCMENKQEAQLLVQNMQAYSETLRKLNLKIENEANTSSQCGQFYRDHFAVYVEYYMRIMYDLSTTTQGQLTGDAIKKYEGELIRLFRTAISNIKVWKAATPGVGPRCDINALQFFEELVQTSCFVGVQTA